MLDASLTLTWLLEDAGERHYSYAFAVLRRMKTPATDAQVPVTWGLEVANVVARCEAKGIVTGAQSASFLEMLGAAPITVDAATAAQCLSGTLQRARRYRLSSYDASYLELSVRLGCALATLDQKLRRAALKAGVELLQAA